MIDFSGVKILSYSHNHNYFGELFRFGVTKSLNIEGCLYDLSNQEGTSGIWAGISGLVSGASDYSNIILNGTNYGPGRIDEITFSEGNDVRLKKYSASLSIFSSGNLFNMTGAYYSGLDLNNINAPIYLAENFSEELSFDLNEDKEWLFNHNIKVKFISGAAQSGSNNPITMAKSLVSGIFSVTNPLSLFDSSYYTQYNTNARTFYTESYDAITNDCSFGKKMLFGHGTGFYNIAYTHSSNTNEDGITDVVEDGKIIGLTNLPFEAAKSGYDIEANNFFNRCSGVFSAYKPSGAYPLINVKNVSKKVLNIFDGSIGYAVSYNNDLRNHNTYTWEYTQEINKESNCLYNVSENGKIKGISSTCSQSDLYANAYNGYSSIISGVSGRASSYYNLATHLNNPLKNISRSEAKSQLKGEIDYEFSFSDDPNSNISGFKKIEYSIEDSYPVQLVGKFIVPGVKELIQPQNNSTVGKRSVKLNINGYRITPLSDYLAYSKNKLNTFIPAGEDTFVEGVNYSLNSGKANFNINCEWAFFGTTTFTGNNL